MCIRYLNISFFSTIFIDSDATVVNNAAPWSRRVGAFPSWLQSARDMEKSFTKSSRLLCFFEWNFVVYSNWKLYFPNLLLQRITNNLEFVVYWKTTFSFTDLCVWSSSWGCPLLREQSSIHLENHGPVRRYGSKGEYIFSGFPLFMIFHWKAVTSWVVLSRVTVPEIVR